MERRTVALDAVDADKLRKFDEDRAGAAAFVQQIMVAGERRNAQLLHTGRELWQEIGKKYGIDLQHESFELATDGSNAIVQTGATFG